MFDIFKPVFGYVTDPQQMRALSKEELDRREIEQLEKMRPAQPTIEQMRGWQNSPALGESDN